MSWTALRPEFFGAWVGWANQTWEDIAGATVETASDESGLFEFSKPLAGVEGMPSVLWATHPGFLPAWAHVQSVDGELRFPEVIVMLAASPIQVLVVDAVGAPVPQAEVEQATPIPSSALADLFDPQARRVLRRVTATDTDGRAELAAWDGPMLLRATREGLVSEVWIGDPRPAIQLELRPTFDVGGGVTEEAGSSIEGEQRIVCQVQTGSQLQPLAVLPVSDGAWGPVTLPVLEVDRYRFRIEGWNAEVREQVLEPPAPGSKLRLDFTLRAGLDVFTFVHDEEEQPILDSTSTVMWNQDGLTVEAKAHPREDGHAIIRGVPPGEIHVKAEAPGYVPADGGIWRIPRPDFIAYWIGLVRGRRIEGRVIHGGEPVEDFEISYWPDDRHDQLFAPFRERADGSFFLNASAGKLRLCATARGTSPSETVVIGPGDASPPPLTLELRDHVRGRGQVVDATTGEPLPGACIQPFIANRAEMVAPWGPPLSVANDGAFDCVSFAPGRQRVRFSAPGHSVHWAETFTQLGETIDFGVIPLDGRKDLVVELVSEEDVDFSGFTFFATGEDSIGRQPFGRDGHLVVEDVSAGRYGVVITDGKGLQIEENIVLPAKDDWLFRFPVGGRYTLQITVDPRADVPAGAFFAVTLPHDERPGYLIATLVPPDRRLELASPFTGAFRVEITSVEGITLSWKSGQIRPEDAIIPVHLDLGALPHRFLVVDPEGRRVPHVRFHLFPVGSTYLGGAEDAGEDGECSVAGLSPGPYLAYLDHPDLGYDFGKPLDLPPPTEEPIKVVFAPNNAVELQLVDGVDPLPWVSCRLIEEQVSYTLPVAASDAAGIVRWEAIGSGRFTVKIQQPGFWPTEAIVEALPPGQRTEVQVRRLGDLDVNVERVSGGLVEGAGLELDSLEFSASVATWIADGRVKSSTGSLALDDQGHLSLTGLPRGLYRWAIEGQEGTIDVPPGVRDSLTALLP